MRIWITSFLVLFGLAELYQWAKGFSLPLPVYILGGAFLAIASNYDKRASFLFQRVEAGKPGSLNQTSPVMSSPHSPSCDLPSQSLSNSADQLSRSISFKIEDTTKQALKNSGQSTKL